jgi:hypothetical protein
VIVHLLAGCVTKTDTVPQAPVDQPSLSMADAIAIVRDYAIPRSDIESSSSLGEALAGNSARKSQLYSYYDWDARYAGKGRWVVELHGHELYYYRWSVFENTREALFTGAYNVK